MSEEDGYTDRRGLVNEYDQDHAAAIEALRGARGFFLVTLDDELAAHTTCAVPDTDGLLTALFLETVVQEAQAMIERAEEGLPE